MPQKEVSARRTTNNNNNDNLQHLYNIQAEAASQHQVSVCHTRTHSASHAVGTYTQFREVTSRARLLAPVRPLRKQPAQRAV